MWVTKEQENEQAEDQNDQRMAVQFVGIALENLAAHVDGGIAGGVGAEKQEQQQPSRCHYQFLADRGSK